jgi:hypothetical protein
MRRGQDGIQQKATGAKDKKPINDAAHRDSARLALLSTVPERGDTCAEEQPAAIQAQQPTTCATGA